ncbi:MAG TPA: MerR family transcriptional regulator, partial [Nitriliruptoraceae bacterium]|nr:MerR family transcriptional regulator [Nitriliruptoraceae bacterium]
SGNTRRYSQRDIDRLRFIRHLTQEEGLNLAGVRVVLDLGEKLERARQQNRELEDMVRTLADQIQGNDSRPASRRHDIVPVGAREVEVHPTLRRRHPRQRAGTR